MEALPADDASGPATWRFTAPDIEWEQAPPATALALVEHFDPTTIRPGGGNAEGIVMLGRRRSFNALRFERRPRKKVISWRPMPRPRVNLEFAPAGVRDRLHTRLVRSSWDLYVCEPRHGRVRSHVYWRDYSLTIGPSGEVLDVQLDDVADDDPAVRRCVTARLRALTLPPAGPGASYEALVYWEKPRHRGDGLFSRD